MGGALTVKVECYSGVEYAGWPLAVVTGQERLPIAKILSEEYTPQGKRFRALLEDGRQIELDYCESDDTWKVTGLPERKSARTKQKQ
jgi:hypothetical protein